jgi:hypothetical protein
MLRSLIALLLTLASLALDVAPLQAAEQVDVNGRVVAVRGASLTLDADGALLTLDASEVDRRFLETLQPGDDVRVTAFRLPDGSLLVYTILYQPDDRRDADASTEPPQGGTE